MVKATAHSDNLKPQVSILPSSPGVYLYLNETDEVIYVGKAKNLKKRVGSYFAKKNTGKTRILVSRIQSMNYIIVDSESDALLLENNLIKKYQPKYNVLLKDDKTFPWICIKNENFPRIFTTRNKTNDGSEYYGPYTSMVLVRTILDLIRQLYPIRTCSLKLTEQNINKQKFKVCLEYHLGKCKAPCVGRQTEKEYLVIIENVRSILKGNIHGLQEYLKSLMKHYSADYKYEEALYIKEKIKILENYRSKSTVVSPKITNIDVYTIVEDRNTAFVNYLKVVGGAIIQSRSLQLNKKLEETKKELMMLAITEIQQKLGNVSRETLVPFLPEYDLPETKFIVPKRGEKKKLLDLSERNASYFMLEKKKRQEIAKLREMKVELMEAFKKDLHLKMLPVHIECFDNSNIQGKNPVAACVVFRNGKPRKSEYRHYNIKTVKGANDFASMKEVIFRRYRRLLEENKGLPQAVFVDGGKGQLSAAIEALEELNLRGKIPVFGIAKRLEEIYVPADPVPLYLDKNSQSLRLIQNLRNEAHRFGISFHRQKRSNEFLNSEFDEIVGIGPKSIQKLLSRYKSLERIKKLKFKELEMILGRAKAEILIQYLQNSSK
ncbi:MAG: excinuclease ABC subunit UvrC [Bacteroidota bacterium]|nr:excinuclease ABC subunit UvrC [Bacteroidota bacterium]